MYLPNVRFYKLLTIRGSALFFKNEINSQDKENKPDHVVESEVLIFEKQNGKNGKDQQGNDFLDHF